MALYGIELDMTVKRILLDFKLQLQNKSEMMCLQQLRNRMKSENMDPTTFI